MSNARDNINFQTKHALCLHMAKMILGHIPFDEEHDKKGYPLQGTILEPTPGAGNLVEAIKVFHPDLVITAPDDFFDLVPVLHKSSATYPRFDYVIMNPPFTPMRLGYSYLQHCMKMSDHIVALLPWFILINSIPRLNAIRKFGLVSVTNIPRSSFVVPEGKTDGPRIQCCLLHMKKGYADTTIFKTFEFEQNAKKKRSNPRIQ